jgi:hypothetical protein
LIEEFFFLSLNSWCRAWPFFMNFKLHKWMKNCFQSDP